MAHFGLEEARRRIAAAAKANAEELDLGGLGLTEIPEELYALGQLKVLYLGAAEDVREKPYFTLKSEDKKKCNAVRALPPALFTSLPHLTRLHLEHNRLNGVPREIAALTGLTSLNLTDNGINDDGARTLTALTGLTSLDLTDNQIGDDGARALAVLIRLTSLDLTGNRIGEGGARALAALTGLASLNLAHNGIGDDGAWALAALTGLTSLNLRNIGIGAGGARALAALTGLASLNLSDNGVGGDGARALAALTGLASLNLSDNGIGEGGARALAALTGLASLDLATNSIGGDGARALAALTGLASLNLASNGIGDDGARALAALTGLTSLDLWNNGIGDDGARALAALTGLTSLHLSRNQVGDDGARALAALTGLTTLHLRSNRIGADGARALLEVFASRANSSRLQRLHLDPELAESLELTLECLESGDAQAIFSAYRAIGQAAEVARWNEAKLLIVGDEAVGKTSLVRFLVHGLPRNDSETETEGIDIKERVNVTAWSMAADDINVNVWDFGGQVILRGTHQFFFSERSLYLVVLSDRLRDDARVYDWLKTIANHSAKSPVIVVINKSDDGKCDLQLNEAELRRDHPNIVTFHRTSCNDDDWARASIAALRTLIGDTLAQHRQLKHIRDPIPKHWLHVKTGILARARDKYVLPVNEFEALCQEAARGTGNDNDELFKTAGRRALLRQLHELGLLVAHGLKRDAPAAMREINLLDPNWLTFAVYRILRRSALPEKQGRFARTDLKDWLDSALYPEEWHEFILSMMTSPDIGLCFPIRGEAESWLVPAALPKNTPDFIGGWPEYKRWAKDSLRFRYSYIPLPSDLMPRFLVEAHERLTSQPTLWSTGAVLEAAGCRVLVVANKEKNVVDVLVDGDASPNRRRDALNRIQDNFDRIHGLYQHNNVERRVPLPDQPEVDESYDHLLTLECEDGKAHEYRPVGAKRRYRVEELLEGVRQPLRDDVHEAEPQSARPIEAQGWSWTAIAALSGGLSALGFLLWWFLPPHWGTPLSIATLVGVGIFLLVLWFNPDFHYRRLQYSFLAVGPFLQALRGVSQIELFGQRILSSDVTVSPWFFAAWAIISIYLIRAELFWTYNRFLRPHLQRSPA